MNLSKKPKPLCYFSVLTFHDAIELFLILGSEVHDIKTKNTVSILDYWELFKDKKGITLSQKEAVRNLNRARYNLKHHGLLPSDDHIEGFRATVTNFFEENTFKIFRIDFSNISLAEIVANKEAREYLKKAEKSIKSNKKKAFLNICDAYRCLIRDSEGINLDLTISTPDETLSEIERKYRHGNLIRYAIKEFASEIESSLHEVFSEVQDILNALTLGINYEKYKRFKKIIQKYGVTIAPSKVLRIRRTIDGDDPLDKITEDEVEFCFDFVIDLALSIQEQQ